MIEINSKLAQTIVDKMMKVIPYNINIMNNKGVIIGSGDKSRVGTLHQGAVQAIQENRMVEITEDTKYVKKGVNMPIKYEGVIMGVIGISGEANVVKPFGELVKITAELLLSQENIANLQRVKEKEKEEYIFKWVYGYNDYTKEFIEKGKMLNIDILIKRRAILIQSKKKIKDKENFLKYLSLDEYHIALEEEKLLLLIREDRLEKFIEDIKEEIDLGDYYIGISEEKLNMGRAFYQSIDAAEIGIKLNLNNNMIYYENVSYIFAILESKTLGNMLQLGEKFCSKGYEGELTKTFMAYLEFNGEMNKIAKYLNIHRNTLNYRIEKIKNITGKDIRNYSDLINLYLAYVTYIMKNSYYANDQ
ncbi:MAG: sugar diacid recognition domain-containing protein [Clostridiaceae bacterium]